MPPGGPRRGGSSEVTAGPQPAALGESADEHAAEERPPRSVAAAVSTPVLRSTRVAAQNTIENSTAMTATRTSTRASSRGDRPTGRGRPPGALQPRARPQTVEVHGEEQDEGRSEPEPPRRVDRGRGREGDRTDERRDHRPDIRAGYPNRRVDPGSTESGWRTRAPCPCRTPRAVAARSVTPRRPRSRGRRPRRRPAIANPTDRHLADAAVQSRPRSSPAATSPTARHVECRPIWASDSPRSLLRYGAIAPMP